MEPLCFSLKPEVVQYSFIRVVGVKKTSQDTTNTTALSRQKDEKETGRLEKKAAESRSGQRF